MIVFVLAFSMLAAIPAAAANAAAAREWNTDVRLSIAREGQLVRESGMDLAAWDKTLDEMKRAGLASPITAEALRAADKDALILSEGGTVYQLGPSRLYGTVKDTSEAYRLAYRLVGLLGGSALTDLMVRSRLTMNDTTVYSFQQLCDGEEVLGGALKIALDASGRVTAVFACLDAEASRAQTSITREQAEALAASEFRKQYGKSVQALTQYTQRGLKSPTDMPLCMNVDVDTDPIPNQVVWIVYTEDAPDTAREYPYLAHYVQTNGTYLYSLPVREPGDIEAKCGYRKDDVFSGMTPDSYTCELPNIDGSTRTVTVPVMRSEADGCWYLGDVERRIAFADYFAKAYDEKHELVLVKSENNQDWDTEDIYMLYNYIRAWDFYADMGWIGPDGDGTDVLIFKGMCYSSGAPYENACSLGKLECWQVFSYAPYGAGGNPTRLTWALDVLAHEYTHTFTGTLMNQNLYENDLGAINEAMSDIFGNLVEYICKDSTDSSWLLGENTGDVLRNMCDPEAFQQPSSVWGLYYAPHVDENTTTNDRGGVHCNSSLLNLIAAKLCTEYGMSYEDAVTFWLMVTMGLTPRTDYVQMSALLTWAMEQSGLGGKYRAPLEQLIEQTRIARTDLPETLPEGQKLIRLVLPETEAFRNENWVLHIAQQERKTQEKLTADARGIVSQLFDPAEDDGEAQLASARRLAQELCRMGKDGALPSEILGLDDPVRTELLLSLLYGFYTHDTAVSDYLMQCYAWEEMDTGVMPIILEDRPALYFLYNISAGGSQLDKAYLLLGDRWIDLFTCAPETDAIGADVFLLLIDTLGMQKRDVVEENGLPVEYLPTAGLEEIKLDS